MAARNIAFSFLPFALVIFPGAALAAYNTTPYYASSTSDAIVQIPVTAGEIVQIWATAQTGCGAAHFGQGNLNIYSTTGGATTTIGSLQNAFSSGAGSNAACTITLPYTDTISGSDTLNIEAINNGGYQTMSVTANVLSVASSTGGGGSGTTTINTQFTATTSQNALVVDNPIQDLFEGLILMLIVAAGIIWIFKKR